MQSKQKLRIRAKSELANITNEEKKNAKDNFFYELMGLIDDYDSWLVYVAFEYEVNISNFVEELRKKKKKVYLAQVVGDEIIASEYEKSSEIFQGKFGEANIASPNFYRGPIDICLVPGLAFDKRGYRLGHGKGFYDRFFQSQEKQQGEATFKIGISYKKVIIPEIKDEDHDIKMDKIISY